MSDPLTSRSRAPLVALLAAIIVLVGVLAWRIFSPASLPAQPATSVAAAAILTQPVPADLPNADQVRRGQYLVRVGDCLSCHLAAGGKPFAGGLGLNTPFGVIYSTNITPDKATGIGNWSADQFYRSMHDGIGNLGEHLYPAFPYPWFTHVGRTDSDAILTYLKTVPAVSYSPPHNKLPFPTNVRLSIAAWNALNFKEGPLRVPPGETDEWKRGALIVNGLGHCGACHTPRNLTGGDQSDQAFRGGELESSFAPDLTNNDRKGLGRWSVADIVEYLGTGRNVHSSASSQMADVITYSTGLMNADDLRAIAVYLKGLPASPDGELQSPDAGAMRRGAAIFSDACTGCHLERARGQSRIFPPLGTSAMAQQDNPTGLIHLILAGARVGPSPKSLAPFAMPSFAWKLDDQEVADVATYVRNSWGNRASPVSARSVHALREKLDLMRLKLTANSGDHDPTERTDR